MNVSELIDPELVIINLQDTSSKVAIITEMANKLKGRVSNIPAFIEDVLKREEQASTGIGDGIAIPHAKSSHVIKPSIVFARSTVGVDFDAIDEEPVNLFFLLAVPESASNEHLLLLTQLSKLLLNSDFKTALLNAKTPQEVIEIFNKFQPSSNKPVANKESSNEPKKLIIAVTACPTGIAHTFMAQEALEKAAKSLGVLIKVETNGAAGIENALTDDDIKNADGIILAINRNVEMSRFRGKKIIQVGAQEAISKADDLIKKALAGEGHLYSAAKTDESVSKPTSSSSKGADIYKHLMTGVSYMLPFVISGGILIALAFVIDRIAGVQSGSGLGSTTYLANLFMTIGKQAFGLFVPILAAFIAYSIANRAALTAGLVGGALASATGGGFFGAIIAGFLSGYLTRLIIKLLSKTPKSLDGIKTILILPVLTVLLTSVLMMVLFNDPIKWANDHLLQWLNSMSSVNKVLLGVILGGMMAVDMGGPFNKAAYVFGVASLATGPSEAMAAVMAGGMVPPLAIALGATLFKDKFSPEQVQASRSNYVMGLSFITEGAIPFVASDPLRMVPICVAGSALAGALSMYFGVNLPAPHGGLIVMFLSNHVGYYLLSVFLGSVLSAILIGLFKKTYAVKSSA